MDKKQTYKNTIQIGNPLPFGVSIKGNWVNFSVPVRGGDCTLLLYKRGSSKIYREIPFRENMRIGNVYTMQIKDLPVEKLEYNYRIGDEIITDPYAKVIVGKERFGKLPKQKVRAGFLVQEYDWQQDCFPQIPFEDTVLYKLHVRGFTRHATSQVEHKGSYTGIVEKIPYFKELGVNMLLLMPCYEFDEVMKQSIKVYGKAGIEDLELTQRINYWGYTKGFYFSPKASYGKANGKECYGHISEFKDMVKKLHENQIEVCMEFYFMPDTPSEFIVDCFRYWVMEYHIDGIYANLNENMIATINDDSILASTKLFATQIPGDFDYYQTKHLQKRLAVVEDSFMRCARKFVKGDEDQVGTMAYLTKKNPGHAAVVNYLANHDGFTLMDAVSYDRKHNEENGENNQDGTDYNYSWNCGFEGKTRRKKVIELRIKQIKNALVMLLFSQGVPMIYAGDEFGRTQNGNNNAYCQDNKVSWVDWSLKESNQEIYDFVKKLLAFRKENRILHMKEELRVMDYRSIGYPDISYHSGKAWYPDYNHINRHLGIMYCGKYAKEDAGNIYVAYNMHWEPQVLGIPWSRNNEYWQLYLDTSNTMKADVLEENQREILVPPRTTVVLIGKEYERKKQDGHNRNQ